MGYAAVHSIENRLLLAKYNAARYLWRFFNVETDERLARIRREISQSFLLRLLLVIVDRNALPVQRACAAFVLEALRPGWRAFMPPEITGLLLERDSPEVRLWRKNVLKRDAYQCVQCESKERLEAHHVIRWADAPELRLVVDNGMTLCNTCHLKEHRYRSVENAAFQG
jgi:hypothetical protein